MATTGHESEVITVGGLKASLQKFKTDLVDPGQLIPVDISTLTPSSTFVRNNIIGINGVLYRAIRDTSEFPVTLVVSGNAFVVTTINGKTALVVSDDTISQDWEMWTDASVEYSIAQIDLRVTALENIDHFSGDYNDLDNKPTLADIPDDVNHRTVTDVEKQAWSSKQAAIDDLSDIRSGAEAGATAYQKPTGGIPSTDLAFTPATLDGTGKVPAAQLPSYVDDVVEGYLNTTDGKFYFDSTYTQEISAESGKIYTDLSTSKTYRWGGTAYSVISETIALGETASTAYRGDRGKIAYDHSQNTAPHVTAQQKTELAEAYNQILYPVDISTLTPSSTFVKGNILCINGVLYRAKVATSSFPVTLVVSDGAFVVNVVNGKIAFVVSDDTLSSDWEVWGDASLDYFIVALDTRITALENGMAARLTGVKVGTTSYQPVNGIVSLPAYPVIPASLPASDVPQWAKASSKPTYNYSELQGTPGFRSEQPTVENGMATIAEMAPNTVYSLGELTSLTISAFGSAVSGVANDYCVEFDSGATATVITWPTGVTVNWKDTLTISANKHYELNIRYSAATQQYYGLVTEW